MEASEEMQSFSHKGMSARGTSGGGMSIGISSFMHLYVYTSMSEG